VALKSRSCGPAVWVYRWREGSPQGKGTRKSAVIGTAEQYKTKAQAQKAAEGYRLTANREGREKSEPTFGALIERFILEEKLRDAKDRPRTVGVFEMDEEFDAEALDPSTANSYLSILKVHIRPRWGESSLSEVRPAMVQEWLRGLVAAPKTKGHVKALMHRLFEKAMLWELLPVGRNPMELVHVKGISKRTKKQAVLDPDQCLALIASLPDPYRTMVLVAICTGLRVSEILALRWSRIQFDRLTMMVKVKAVNGRIGRLKTECSEDELPLDPEFAAVLLDWKARCRPTVGDWVFPSHITDRCFHASPIQQDYIRPAGEKLGMRGVGWHTFRHTYRAWLDAVGAPIGVQQKLMRHAHASTTAGYGGALLMSSKRDANSKVVQMALGPNRREEHVA
jgi:integrase